MGGKHTHTHLPGRKESDKETQSDTANKRRSRENPPSVFSELAIYFRYAPSDSFPISPNTQCIVADWALSCSHLLMTHQPAWLHIIDMPIQMDVSVCLSRFLQRKAASPGSMGTSLSFLQYIYTIAFIN